MQVTSHVREPLVTGGKTYHDVTEDVCKQVEGAPSSLWKFCFGFALVIFAIGSFSLYKTWTVGLGVWGLNKTVGWAWDITNFVWWVGIGHAGTLYFCRIIIVPSKVENIN